MIYWDDNAVALLDDLETLLPLDDKISMHIGSSPTLIGGSACPLWFTGDEVRIDINRSAPYGHVALSLIQAYALAYALGRVGAIPSTREEEHAFETAIYEVYFEVEKIDTHTAAAYRTLGLPSLRFWLKETQKVIAKPPDRN